MVASQPASQLASAAAAACCSWRTKQHSVGRALETSWKRSIIHFLWCNDRKSRGSKKKVFFFFPDLSKCSVALRKLWYLGAACVCVCVCIHAWEGRILSFVSFVWSQCFVSKDSYGLAVRLTVCLSVRKAACLVCII